MKLSRYSIELGEQYYYNSCSNSIIKVTKKIDETLKNESLQLLTTEELNTLFKNGFIVNKDYDELQILKFNHNRSKFAARNASFIIYPTMQCNFDCYYCFEKNKKSALNANKTAILSSAIIKFITNNRLNKLSIRWSGGEPLLAWTHVAEILENLNKSVLDCKIYNTLATNGYLLNDEIITKLKDFDFQEVVVTLDGPESIHDNSRTIKGNNTKTFQRIVQNIAKLSIYVPVIVRINIDKNNYNSVETLLKELVGLHLNNKDIKIFCKPVIPCWSCTPDKSMLNME
ncbi:MAG: radical SAM protein [Salinivirgaceae bacterium]|nr:radical SAM protein [Salinivirgaceae bacterium]